VDLYLIRHPTPLLDRGICYGQSDVPVSPEILEQTASRLGRLLPAGDGVFSSPLSRCRLLAERLGRPVRIDERLKERSFGLWELSSWDTIGGEALDAWAGDLVDFAPPGGESAREVDLRVESFLTEVTGLPAAVSIVVAHGGPLSLILARLLGLPVARSMDLVFECGAATLINVEPARSRLVFFNR
jgi:alpha-ribazole phosphatase